METYSFEERPIRSRRPFIIELLWRIRRMKIRSKYRAHMEREIEEDYREDLKLNKTTQADWKLAAYSESLFRKSRGVLYGNWYGIYEGCGSEYYRMLLSDSFERSQRRQIFASLGSVEELKDFMFNMKQVLHFIESRSTSAEFLNFSVSEEFRSSLLDAMKSRNWEKVESMVMPVAAALPRRAAIYDAFIVLASLLLSAIFQYLMALVDKGGTRIHSSDSREFRSRYISIVLFQGAYVWIKFREVAPESQQKPLRGLYRRCKTNELGVKVYYGNYEPRFKPLGCDSYISVGSYEEEEDARIIYQILAFYYGREVPGELPLLNGSTYRIPCMTEEEQRLDPASKKEWAKGKAKVVFEEFKGALMESILWDCLLDSPEVEATGNISNNLPPDAGAGCDGQRVQLGNQSGDGLDVPVSPNNSSPDVGPGIPVHVADDSCNDHAAAAAGTGVSDEPPTEPTLEELLASFIPDSQEVQATGDISNIFPPDAGAGCGAPPDFQLGNRSDGSDLAVFPSNFSPNVDPQIPIYVADDIRNDHAAAAGAGVSDEPPLEPHYQHHASEENQSNNVNPDDLSVLRLVKEVQRQQQLQQILIQQQESRIQQLEFQNQQRGSQISVLERNQQLQKVVSQQQKSRIAELEDELLRSTEPARKRICVGLSLRHNS